MTGVEISSPNLENIVEVNSYLRECLLWIKTIYLEQPMVHQPIAVTIDPETIPDYDEELAASTNL
jgi:hypothetical protein